jgi:hypothetical protein
MLKQLFKKLQKIPISIEIKHFFVLTVLFDQFKRYLFFKNVFRELIKFSLINGEKIKNFKKIKKTDFLMG